MFEITKEVIGLPPYEEARRELLSYPQHESIAKVAISDSGAIIGFCSATYPYWNAVAIIDYLVVASGFRHRGEGSRLVSIVESNLRKTGVRFVSAQTAAWNSDAVQFYEHLGYTQRAVFSDYFGDKNDLIRLDRRL